jgi:hypothetical protein
MITLRLDPEAQAPPAAVPLHPFSIERLGKVATALDEFEDHTAMKAALGMSDATVARYAEHRRFDRAVALLAKYETRHKLVTTPAEATAEERPS